MRIARVFREPDYYAIPARLTERMMRQWDWYLDWFPDNTQPVEYILARIATMVANFMKGKNQSAFTTKDFLYERMRPDSVVDPEPPSLDDLDRDSVSVVVIKHPDTDVVGEEVLTGHGIRALIERFNRGGRPK
jgi:hypothetical protein